MASVKEYLSNTLEIEHGTNTPIFSMQGMRGLAVLLVFLVHYTDLIQPYLGQESQLISQFIFQLGHLGVDLFFVLSGYLIYGSIMKRQSFNVSTYAMRRIQRIYPTFLAVFFIYVFISIIMPWHSKFPDTGTALYTVQNLLLLPGLLPIEPVITVAWSLSYEAFYYLLVPVLILTLKLKKWAPNARIFYWSTLSVLYIIISCNPDWVDVWDHRVHLVFFVAGILLYELYDIKGIRLARGGTRILLVALLIGSLRATYALVDALVILSLFLLFLTLCISSFNRQSTAYKWLTLSPLRWLGNMSYSYYLLHGLVLKICFVVYASMLPDSFTSHTIYLTLFLPSFLATLIGSYALFMIIERPLSLHTKPLDGTRNKHLLSTTVR